MLKHSIYIQTEETAGAIYDGLMRTASSASYDRLTVVMAYATRVGCELLTEGFTDNLPSWDQIKKRWLISIDGGITQPDALVYLAELPNSIVKIPCLETPIGEDLKIPFRLHSKLYLFESLRDNGTIALFSGSCNLTQSGLLFNAEQATSIIMSSPVSLQEKPIILNIRRQRAIINRMFKSSIALNDDLLEKYRRAWQPTKLPKLEHKRHTNTLEANPVIQLSEAISLALAESFWIKVTDKVVANRGKDKPGNQIDLHQGSRVFFGFGVGEVPPNTVFGQVPIRFEGSTSYFSVRFGNNYMDKINLPPLDFPRTYAAKTLLFKRNNNGVYDLTIGNNRLEKQWQKISTNQGTFYRMQSGRPYGVFSKQK
jgi:HKD family nuclease